MYSEQLILGSCIWVFGLLYCLSICSIIQIVKIWWPVYLPVLYFTCDSSFLASQKFILTYALKFRTLSDKFSSCSWLEQIICSSSMYTIYWVLYSGVPQKYRTRVSIMVSSYLDEVWFTYFLSRLHFSSLVFQTSKKLKQPLLSKK